MRHEITSWHLNENEDNLVATPSAGSSSIHVVVVVDQSGSMKKDDVPGFPTRTAAVYDNIAHGLLRPLLKHPADSKWFVTLIMMRKKATLVHERMELNESLFRLFLKRKDALSKSHGNYLPALSLANEVLTRDNVSSHKKIVFLSDGAPSDHKWKPCSHGTYVWKDFSTCTGPWRKVEHVFLNNITGEQTEQEPPGFDCSKMCRNKTQFAVKKSCEKILQDMEAQFGQDEFSLQV